MATISLRRVKPDLQYQRSEVVEHVVLSATERQMYDFILARTKKMLSCSGGNSPSHVLLRSILQLRQLCSHGNSKNLANTSPSIQSRKNTSICDQCGESLDLSQALTPETQGDGQEHLCYDCALRCDGNAFDIVSHSPFASYLKHDEVKLLEMKNQTCIGPSSTIFHYDDLNIHQNMPISHGAEESSKLMKVFSNLRHIQQSAPNGQTLAKRSVTGYNYSFAKT